MREPLAFFLGVSLSFHRVFTYTEGLNPFGLRILQLVDFGADPGAELSSEPQIGIIDFHFFGPKAFGPYWFSAENQQSLKRFCRTSISSQNRPQNQGFFFHPVFSKILSKRRRCFA